MKNSSTIKTKWRRVSLVWGDYDSAQERGSLQEKKAHKILNSANIGYKQKYLVGWRGLSEETPFLMGKCLNESSNLNNWMK